MATATEGSGDATSPKSQQDILTEQIHEGLSELRRPWDGLFLSGLSAGLDVGFGPALMAVMLTLADFSFANELTKELLMASAYTVGFILVVLGRSELFTEHTTLAVLPVLDRQASVGQLARLWSVVYAGNIVGAVLFAAFLAVIGPATGVIEPAAFTEIATGLVEHPWWVLVGAGVLAGWLMGLLSWLVAAGQESFTRVLFVFICTSAIALLHAPHCIAGTVEVVMGVLGGTGVGLGDFAYFLVFSTIGNVVGGTVFVALLKYGHVARSGPRTERPAGW
ncbi:formate/nitrite transporter family protein [Halomarina litorea]|uniref:formate/nitrite transporter family protein n=1 Tax=Halomarina litorea TaxID=2961595 RepID=UPI0020C40CAB|nr:formate/nitrite transporter family protein [Halomarina sp. BCD28]